ncbi:zinc finger protein 14-like, partial [Myotis lucifugus]|uniref:zinc finger protein 14-like n=1 Tax=Myotis lucifugus TaxID=59463 RepID=UPI000CCC528B
MLETFWNLASVACILEEQCDDHDSEDQYENHWMHLSHMVERLYTRKDGSQCRENFSQIPNNNEKKEIPEIKQPKSRLCRQIFIHYLSLNNHLSSHIGPKLYLCQEYEEKRYKYKEAEKAFKPHQHIQSHEGSHCKKTFHYSTSLRNHERTHIPGIPNECEQYGKGFSHLTYFKLHKNTHSGEKPCQSKQCGKAFSSFKYSGENERHTAEKPYQCKKSGIVFSSTSLRSQEKTHSGEKPYECGNVFSWLSSLGKHKR